MSKSPSQKKYESQIKALRQQFLNFQKNGDTYVGELQHPLSGESKSIINSLGGTDEDIARFFKIEPTSELLRKFRNFQINGMVYDGSLEYKQLNSLQKDALKNAGATEEEVKNFFNQLPEQYLSMVDKIPKPSESHTATVSNKPEGFGPNATPSKPQSIKPSAQSAGSNKVPNKPSDSSSQPVIESSGQHLSSLDIQPQAVLTSGLNSDEVSHQPFSPDSPVRNTQTAASSTPSKQWIATFLQGCAVAALCYAIYQYGDVVQQGVSTICPQALPFVTIAIESAYDAGSTAIELTSGLLNTSRDAVTPAPLDPSEVLYGTMSKALTVSSQALPTSLPSNTLVLRQTPDYVNAAECPALLQCGLSNAPLIDLNNLWQTLSLYIPSFSPGDSLQNVLSQLSNVVSQNQLGADVREALIQFGDMSLVPVGEGTQPPPSLVQNIMTFLVNKRYPLAVAATMASVVGAIVYTGAFGSKQPNNDPSAPMDPATGSALNPQPGAEDTVSPNVSTNEAAHSTATNAETATASWISTKNLLLAAIVIGAGVALPYAYPSVVEPLSPFLSGAAAMASDLVVAGKDMVSENAQYYGKDWQSWLTNLAEVGAVGTVISKVLPTVGKQTMAAVKGLTSGRSGTDRSELPQTQSAAAVDGSVQLLAVAPIHANTPNLSTAPLDPDTFRLQHAGQLNGQRHSCEVVYRRDGKEHMPDSAQYEALQNDIAEGFKRDQVKVDWRNAPDASNQSLQSVEFNAGYHGIKEAMAAMPGMKIRATGSHSQAFFHGMCQAVRDQYPHARLSHHIAGYGELVKEFGHPPTNRPNRLKPLQEEVLQKTQGAEVDLGISSNDAGQTPDPEHNSDPDDHPDNPTQGLGGNNNPNS